MIAIHLHAYCRTVLRIKVLYNSWYNHVSCVHVHGKMVGRKYWMYKSVIMYYIYMYIIQNCVSLDT